MRKALITDMQSRYQCMTPVCQFFEDMYVAIVGSHSLQGRKHSISQIIIR